MKQGQSLCWDDVAVDTGTDAYKLRREMEALFAPRSEPAATMEPSAALTA